MTDGRSGGGPRPRCAPTPRTPAGGSTRIYYCPHDWDEGCDCRKPRPGMLFQAQREFDLDLTRTPFIGDDERDGQAADAAGCPFLRVDATDRSLARARAATCSQEAMTIIR